MDGTTPNTLPLPSAEQCMTAGHMLASAAKNGSVQWYLRQYCAYASELHRRDMIEKLERAARELGLELVPIAPAVETTQHEEAA